MLPYTEQFIAHPPAAIEDYIFYSCNYRSVVFEAASAQENLTERLDTLMNFWAEAAKRRRGLCAQDAASDDLVKEKRHWEVLFMDSPATRAGAECPGSVMTFPKWVVANLS